jgi:type I restriction enzyme S subunit
VSAFPLVPLRAVTLDAQTGPFGSQLHSDEYVDDGIPVINPSNIINSKISPDPAIAITEETSERLARHRLEPGDLVFARRGELGRAAVAHNEAAGWLCGTGSLRVRTRQSALDSRFAEYVLQSASTRAYFEMYAIGSTMGNLNTSIVLGLPIPLPPLDEQRRIANFLDAETARIDRLAALRTSQMEALTVHYQSQLSEKAQELSDRYGTVKVRHVLRKIEQGWSPQCEDRAIRDGEWGVVKAGCVNGGVFDATQHKALPVGTEPELRYRLRAGDLLMSRASGSVDLIGSIAALPDDMPSRLLLCDKVYRLRTDQTRMTPYFVAYMLRTFQMREQIKLGISGAEGMANNLPTATVTNLPLPDVPLHEQGNIVSDLDGARQIAQNTTQILRQQLAVLGERRQALITAAVTGGISV